MNKRLIAFLLAAILILSGCASQASKEAEPEQSADMAAASAETDVLMADPNYAQIIEKQNAEAEHQAELDAVDESQPVDGVYQITTSKGVMNIAAYPDASFELLRDVDMQGSEWTPIEFSGTIKGGDFTISNFTVKEVNGVCGFFSKNSGTVDGLKLADMTMDCAAASNLTLGALAAENVGTVTNCSAMGSAEIKANDGYIGGAVGINAGSMKNVRGGLNMEIPAVTGKLYVGGFVGENKGVDLEQCDGASHLVATSSSGLSVGIFAGKASNCQLDHCRFSGEMNLLDGKLFITFCGEENAVAETGTLIRDNSNSDEFIPEKQLAVRQAAVDNMYAMGSVEWTPDRQLMYYSADNSSVHSKNFYPGITYRGIPYTANYGDLYRFNYCFESDGTLKDWLPTLGFDGFDMYMGNDCSGGVYWAWAPLDPNVSFAATNQEAPGVGCGTLPIGDYDPLSTPNTNEIVDANGTEKILEAYVHLNKGDAVVSLYSLSENDHENHTKLCFANPVVFRDENGKIDPDASYFRTHEQGDGLYHFDTTSWYLDRENESFSNLLGRYYIPITCEAMKTGVVPEVEVSITDTTEDKAHMLLGTVQSNYRLIGVRVVITDGNDNTVMDETQFTAFSKYENVQTVQFARATVKEYDMNKFASAMSQIELEPGKEYHFESTAIVAGGREYPLKSFDFKY